MCKCCNGGIVYHDILTLLNGYPFCSYCGHHKFKHEK